MKNIIRVSLFSLFFFATAPYAETQSGLRRDEPVKVAILGMGVYNVVMSGGGVGAAATLSRETDATNTDKVLADGFDFKAVGKHMLGQYKDALSTVRKWQVVSAKELGKDGALAKFAQAVKDSESKIPGAPSADRYKRWTLIDDLPFVDVQWVLCITCGEYQKAIAEAAKQFCAEAGVDGVWLQSTNLGYGTKEAPSRLFGAFTAGTGQSTAIAYVTYALIDKDGQIIFSTGKTADEYKSDESFTMYGGVKKIDKEMMGYQMDAISVSAKEIAKLAGK